MSVGQLTSAAKWAALTLAMLAHAACAVEWLPAVVELSDGSSVRGRVHITDDKIIIHNEAQERRYSIRTAEMAKLENAIEEQSMEPKWLFRESGLDDKVYTGEHFPVRHYLTRVTFHDGRQLTGHIIAKTLYVESDGTKRRFILRRKDEGKVGETLEDLLYVCSIVFTAEGAGARGTIEGTLLLPPGEKLQKVLAINREKLFSIVADANPLSGKFRVPDCTEGVYDLVVITDRAVYVYSSREQDAGCRRLDADAVAEVQSWVGKLRDFFHTQRIVYAAGNEKRLFALIRKERHGGTTLQGAELIRRCDVWAMHKPREEWQIEKRFYVYRLVSGTPTLKRRAIVISPALGGFRISAQVDTIEPEIKLGPNREKPIPPAAPDERKPPRASPEEPDSGN
ncbi:MAG: hypothetical protein KAX44_07710 [Candidatus Brocadiae bacterium]|nr:hypothetical protein [Candidatus Brocadiia bacterium]